MWKYISYPNEEDINRSLKQIIMKNLSSIPVLEEVIEFPKSVTPDDIFKEYNILMSGSTSTLLPDSPDRLSKFKTAVSQLKECHVIHFENKQNIDIFHPYLIKSSYTIYIFSLFFFIIAFIYSQYTKDIKQYLWVVFGIFILYFLFYFTN